MSLRIVRLRGAEIAARQDDLARLRIEVFRDWPYLYDGDREYEKAYIRTYVDAPDSVLIAAFDGERVVGASTALPMTQAMDACAEPFIAAGYDLDRIFYFGESVLLKPYRGRGVGVRFFEARESAALAHPGIDITAFCAVERPSDHPLRPKDYVPLDAFWGRRGYVKHRALVARFRWCDIDQERDTDKSLSFWLKRHSRG
ncbi:MAG: GNAT family N-acetyltransferase [Alphaproteobacteria bacterium]|nr:GNAT family N-acetyltransferase [Alphaproteobacteria bacterium]